MTQSSGIRRRDALQALIGGVGGGLALPSIVSAQHPMHVHLGNPTALSLAREQVTGGTAGPAFLDAHQLRTLESLAEAIVPGATEAAVAPFLDQLLAVETQDHQRTFIGALGAFDMLAVERYGRSWIDATAADHVTLLDEVSTADPGTPMRDHFQNLKDWIAGAYYSSEPGMRELGWNGMVFHAEPPGCEHPGGHAE